MLPVRDHLPTRRVPIVNYLLIAVNVLAFIWERALIGAGVDPMRLVAGWGLVPHRFLNDPIDNAPTILTSMFMHDPLGWLHIGANMLFLWIFGDNVEDAVGSVRYALFYLACGVAAAAAQIFVDPASRVPMLGASGAIAGVLAAYVSLYPRSPITVVNPILPLWLFFGIFIRLPAWLVILQFFLLNLWSGLTAYGAQTGGVAFFAHIGGFVAGLILIRFFMIGRTPLEHDRWAGWRPPPRARPRRDYPAGWDDQHPPPRSPWDW